MLRNITEEELDCFLRLDVNRAFRIELTEEFENRCIGFFYRREEAEAAMKEKEDFGFDTDYFLLNEIYYVFEV